MFSRRSNHRILIQLAIILILTIFVSVTIWKVFISREESTSQDYQSLAAISPDDVILYQKTKPQSWKDHVALISAIKSISDKSDKESYQSLINQLDKNNVLKKLKWGMSDSKIKKKALSYRKLLDKYPMYSPNKYLYPFEEQCYYTDTYGADREGGVRTHQGTDLFEKKGTPIFSVCSGKIEKLGWNRLGGERVGVRGEDGNYYYYAHLDKINLDLSIGMKINTGDFIGTMGNTGDALLTPDHLHFGIELPNGQWLNPYPFLRVWEFQRFGSLKKIR